MHNFSRHLFSFRRRGAFAARSLVLLASLTVFLTVAVQAQDGTVDLSFAPVLENSQETPFATNLFLQPDGKVIVEGDFDAVGGVARPGIARLNADGSLDTSFDPGTGLGDGSLYATALQADGKLLLAGYFQYYNDEPVFEMIRVNVDGSLDHTFQGQSYDSPPEEITVQADGKILIMGNFDNVGSVNQPSFARLNTDGSLDTSFVPGRHFDAQFSHIVQQPDGKLLVCAARTDDDGDALPPLVRLNPDGSVDPSFVPAVATQSQPGTLVLLSDGRILAGVAPAGSSQFNSLIRLMPDGSLDPTFTSGVRGATVIAVQNDGKYLVGGTYDFDQATTYNGFYAMARLNSDGSRDLGFHPSITTTHPYYPAASPVARQPDGKFLIVGSFDLIDGVPRPGWLARLHNEGTSTHAGFFTTEVALGNEAEYLAFPANGNVFGYYGYLADPHYIYHFDLGYEYWLDAADGKDGVYFYDFKSGGYFYTSPAFPFPYLYDFTLNTVLYYFPDPKNPGRYNTDGQRYFYRFDNGQIIVK